MPNHLINENSPYLIQHANNPVDWYPWGDEALTRARSENKPIFLSIGYAACHWCHVMAHESFEDEETAAFMNEHFVSVKVDREARPDIDAIYMQATVAMTGAGGWGTAPKFPQPMAIEFLLRRYAAGSEEALKPAVHALNAISRGGMYDVVGEAFHATAWIISGGFPISRSGW